MADTSAIGHLRKSLIEIAGLANEAASLGTMSGSTSSRIVAHVAEALDRANRLEKSDANRI